MAKVLSAVEKAHARLKKLQDRKGGGNGEFPFNFLNIDDGKTIVRIFKSWNFENDPESEFYKELPYHRAVGPDEKQIKCRGAIGKPCPVCEEYTRLKAKAQAMKSINQEKADGLYKQASSFKARPKFIMNAVKLTLDGPINKDGDAAEKPEVLTAGPMIMDGILSQFVDDEADIGGKFWEEDNKYDFVITRTGKKFDTNYTVKPTRKYVGVDTEALEAELHNIDELFAEFPTYEEVQALMKGEEYDPSDDEEAKEDKPEKAEKKPAKKDEEEVAEDEEVDVLEEDEEEVAPPKKPVSKPVKKVVVEEDEEEVEADDEEEVEKDEEEEDVDPALKKPAKKPAVEEDEEEVEKDEEEEEVEDDKPVCFGEPEDHDPEDKVCKKCPWLKACATVVASKADAAGEEHVQKIEKKLKKVAK